MEGDHVNGSALGEVSDVPTTGHRSHAPDGGQTHTRHGLALEMEMYGRSYIKACVHSKGKLPGDSLQDYTNNYTTTYGHRPKVEGEPAIIYFLRRRLNGTTYASEHVRLTFAMMDAFSSFLFFDVGIWDSGRE